MEKDLKHKSLDELVELVVSHGQKKFAAEYIFNSIHQKDVQSIDDITSLSKAFRKQLSDESFCISNLTISERHDDPDGTVKFAFDLGEKSCIEAVLLKDRNRQTLCISTQAGCRMGCRFCATGQLHFERSLTTAEIVDQVYQAERLCGKIDNVVYMGMGEPLDNFDNVIRSVEILNHPLGRNIGIRHITISTCGLPEQIRKLAALSVKPRLALSLHAPTDTIRKRIMPSAAKHPLHDILASLRFYQQTTGKRFTVEYCMIADVNDSAEQAHLLVNLLKPFSVNVNLIELNPYPGCPFGASSPQQMRQFANILSRSNIETVIRFRRGRSIKAACGQLGSTRLKK